MIVFPLISPISFEESPDSSNNLNVRISIWEKTKNGKLVELTRKSELAQKLGRITIESMVENLPISEFESENGYAEVLNTIVPLNGIIFDTDNKNYTEINVWSFKRYGSGIFKHKLKSASFTLSVSFNGEFAKNISAVHTYTYDIRSEVVDTTFLFPPSEIEIIIPYDIDTEKNNNGGGGSIDSGGTLPSLFVRSFDVFVFSDASGVRTPISNAKITIDSFIGKGRDYEFYTDETGYTPKISLKNSDFFNSLNSGPSFSVEADGYMKIPSLSAIFSKQKESKTVQVNMTRMSIDTHNITITVSARYYQDDEIYKEVGDFRLEVDNNDGTEREIYENTSKINGIQKFVISGSQKARTAYLKILDNNENFLSKKFGEDYPLKSNTIDETEYKISVPSNKEMQDKQFNINVDLTVKPCSFEKLVTFKDFHRMTNNVSIDLLKNNPQKCVSKEEINRLGLMTIYNSSNGTKCEKLYNIKFN